MKTEWSQITDEQIDAGPNRDRASTVVACPAVAAMPRPGRVVCLSTALLA
jgi:hypothetical protein